MTTEVDEQLGASSTARGSRWVLVASMALLLVGASGCCSRKNQPTVRDVPQPGGKITATNVSSFTTSEGKDTAHALVESLGNPSLSREERYAALATISSRNDYQVLEALVEHVDDKRLFDAKARNTQALPGEDEWRPINVGPICETEANRKLLGPASGGEYIKDLKRWWAEHRHLPLEEIQRLAREEVAPKNTAPQR